MTSRSNENAGARGSRRLKYKRNAESFDNSGRTRKYCVCHPEVTERSRSKQRNQTNAGKKKLAPEALEGINTKEMRRALIILDAQENTVFVILR